MTTTIPSKYAELAELAEKATPGPWRYDERSDHGSPIMFSDAVIGPYDGPAIVIGFHQADYNSEAWFEVSDADGEYIAAANPATIQALLRDLMTLREALDAMVDDPMRGLTQARAALEATSQ